MKHFLLQSYVFCPQTTKKMNLQKFYILFQGVESNLQKFYIEFVVGCISMNYGNVLIMNTNCSNDTNILLIPKASKKTKNAKTLLRRKENHKNLG